MWAGSHIVQVCCLFFLFTASLAAESSGAGRRLRVRTADDGAKTSDAQWPLMPAVQTFAQPVRPPVVHFLFLAVGKVNNIDVWKTFFASAHPDQFRAFVHCKTPECHVSVTGSPLVPIPMVASYYCADLVTPMNQLLSEALRAGGPSQNPADKFVFVSDSTLPAKPFSHIYDTLVKRTGSDFCVCSVKEWATRREPPPLGSPVGKPIEMAIKHHQWSILDRSHAVKVTQVWLAGVAGDFMMRFQMNLPPRARSVKTFAGSSDAGCLDEFYHMAAIYGTLPYTNGTAVNLPEFTNSPLQVSDASDLQGSCDTFVAWPAYAVQHPNHTGGNAFNRLYAALDPLSVPYSGNAESPGYWDTISSHGMRAIRASEFLFVRKFVDQPQVSDGGHFGGLFPQLVFQ